MILVEKTAFGPPEWNRAEIRRYARIRGAADGFDTLIDECVREAEPELSYRVCHVLLPIKREGELLTFGGITTPSETLAKALRRANAAVLFAATVGAPFDLLIRKYSKLSPAKALVFQAIGAERVESLCDMFCRVYAESQLTQSGLCLAPRVSPGYGDIPLSIQKDIFAILDCQRKIGLTLDESLMMSPSKSVTAICGVVDAKCGKKESRSCGACQKTDCAYRS